MGFWVGSQDGLIKELRQLREDLTSEIATLRAEKEAVGKVTGLTREVARLTEQTENLKIQKLRLEEEQDKKEREVRHEVGLLRKQVEAEREIAVGRAKLEVEQDNLKSQQDHFEKEMKFTRERFTEEVKYLREIAEAMLARLPVVKVNKRVEESDRPLAAASSEE